MLEGLICPDGQTISVKDCLDQCRLGVRCQEKPDLFLMSREREWTGTPSTTQLLNGTMYEFLKLTVPYYIDPDSRAFMLQGTRHHKELDIVAKKLGLASEIALSMDRDIFDLLVWEGKNLNLVDRKMWGSYKVAKALGIVEAGKIPDPNGEVYKKSGRWGKAGSPKMVSSFTQDPDKADNWEAELQLNNYRILLKRIAGIEVSDMYLRVLVRDGGIAIAFNRGVFRNTYRIPVKFMPDEEVSNYFKYKGSSLIQALADKHWDTPCSVKESWEGLRCERYCEVWEHCSKGVLVHNLTRDHS